VPVRRPQQLNRLALNLGFDPTVRRTPAQPMHYHRVARLLHPPNQLPNPALAHPHQLRSTPLRHHPVPNPLQCLQPIPLVLAHRNVFHPSRFASRGTFYFAQTGTSHFAPTLGCWDGSRWI
jgi:hypothetical protein